MITTAGKFYIAFGAFLLAAGVFYGWTSGGVDWDLFPSELGQLFFQIWGALTLGWAGAVGDQMGYTILVGGAGLAGGIGGMVVAFRDGEAHALAEVAGTERAPDYVPPRLPNYWAPIGGFGMALTAIGLVADWRLFLIGVAVLALAALEWTVQAWADRATGDPVVNARLRNRIMNPIEYPLIGALALGLVALGVSRVLLSVTELGAVWAITGLATFVFLVAIVLAAVPRLSRSVLTGLVALGAIGVLAAGITGVAVGERDFEHHEEGTEEVEGTPAGDSEDDSDSEGEETGSTEGTPEDEEGG